MEVGTLKPLDPEVGVALRLAYPRVLAKTIARTRHLHDAEDAVQEAIARALERWPRDGVPRSVEAWLLTVATNAHRDKQRRGSRQQALERLAAMTPWARVAMAEPSVDRAWKDDLLRLLFACCHPALEPGESAALALATVIGLSVEEIAAAFLVAPRTMEQRLTRARRRLRDQGDPDGIEPVEAGPRSAAVLRAIHLLFSEGYWSTQPNAPLRDDLCRLALGLAHSMVEVLDDDPEAHGLLALLSFHEARRPARLDATGRVVPLPEQDRTLWDRPAIAKASARLEAALAREAIGPFQIEAAIAQAHCGAPSADATPWSEIAALYAGLERFRPGPAVRVNRAFALGRAEGPQAGLALLDLSPDVARYPYVNAVRAELLADAGRLEQARTSLEAALEAARNDAERDRLHERLSDLDRRRRS